MGIFPVLVLVLNVVSLVVVIQTWHGGAEASGEGGIVFVFDSLE